MFINEIRDHLNKDLIPFWKNLRDDENGGYYGYAGFDCKIDKTADKGCILNSRILWFFSSCASVLRDDSCLPYAAHACDFLLDHFLDTQKGGLFWAVDNKGTPTDTTKHTYCQAFAIYGLSAYYMASKKAEALTAAAQLIRLIEERFRDKDGYLEAFDRDFSPASNEKLSENGVLADRTMNTLLHVLEAYTEFLTTAKDSTDNDIRELCTTVRDCLREELAIFARKMYNPEKHRLEVFFDSAYNSLIDLISYGHDIEAAWLIDRALAVLSDDTLTRTLSPITDALAENILKNAFDGHSLPMECENGTVTQKRIWWVQAEAVNGFLNAYRKDPSRTDFRDAAYAVWDFIRDRQLYKNPPREWYSELFCDGTPDGTLPAVSPWKCPYHNGRMCLEALRSSLSPA